jgi:hypothetical protein
MLEGRNKSSCEIFNVGTGKALSVLELVEKFQQSTVLSLITGLLPGDPVISKLFGQTLRWPTGNLDGKLSVPRKRPWLMPGPGKSTSEG